MEMAQFDPNAFLGTVHMNHIFWTLRTESLKHRPPNSGNEQAKVSEAAKKAKCSERIHELAQPIKRFRN